MILNTAEMIELEYVRIYGKFVQGKITEDMMQFYLNGYLNALADTETIFDEVYNKYRHIAETIKLQEATLNDWRKKFPNCVVNKLVKEG